MKVQNLAKMDEDGGTNENHFMQPYLWYIYKAAFALLRFHEEVHYTGRRTRKTATSFLRPSYLPLNGTQNTSHNFGVVRRCPERPVRMEV